MSEAPLQPVSAREIADRPSDTARPSEPDRPSETGDRRQRLISFVLQLGHRAASVALFLVIAGIALWAMGKPALVVLKLATATSLVGLAAGAAAWTWGRSDDSRREAVGLSIFSLACAAPAGVLLAISIFRQTTVE